jgi:hypothetical protein
MRESARWSGSVGVGVGVGAGEGDGAEAVVAPPQPASHIARANVKRGKKGVAGIFARRIITLERSISPHRNLQLEPISAAKDGESIRTGQSLSKAISDPAIEEMETA